MDKKQKLYLHQLVRVVKRHVEGWRVILMNVLDQIPEVVCCSELKTKNFNFHQSQLDVFPSGSKCFTKFRMASSVFFRFILIFIALISLRFTVSCGQVSNGVDFDESAYGELPPMYDRSDFTGKTLTEEEFILSDMYSGKMVFKSDDVADAQEVKIGLLKDGYKVVPMIKNVGRYRRLENVMRLRGAKKLNDLSKWEGVEIKGNDAVGLYGYLKGRGYKVIPKAKVYPTSIDSIIDLEIGQRYLAEDEFDVYSLWDAGITGQGVRIVDNETDAFQLTHQDLPATNTINPCDDTGNPYICDDSMGHATAVAGIMVSIDNNHGTVGMSHDSTIISANGGWSGVEDGITGIHRPGDVYLIEIQVPGAKIAPYTLCGSTPATSYGCIPLEADPDVFETVQTLVEYGVTVVSGGGNGTVSLDSPSTYWSDQQNLFLEDSGSILVGATHGSGSMIKAAFSNAGSVMDLSGWGYNVVTTGYAPPAYLEGTYPWDWAYQWNPVPWITDGGNVFVPDNDNGDTYYVNNFGGTSAAAAQIASSAALIQSYAKSLLGNGETRFLYPNRVLSILKTNAKPQSTTFDPFTKCKLSGWNVNMDAGNCPTTGGYICAGSNPANGGSCTTDDDCKIYGGFETIGSDCVGGKCGSSFCANYCNADFTCSKVGWLPTALTVSGTLTCVCHPPFQSKLASGLVGSQPIMSEAKIAVDDLIADLQTPPSSGNDPDYTKLFNGGRLTVDELHSLRNNKGVGLICGEVDPVTHTVADGDPACPEFSEEDLWPSGMAIAKKLDFDGDGRADLVSWTKGEWKIDLSSRGGDETDHYGEWDLIITYPSTGKWEIPYTADMDSDTREDLVVYNKEKGTWYIKFMKNAILDGEGFNGWDWIINTGVGTVCKDKLEMDYTKSVYGRPFISDTNHDNWNDLEIVCSDGNSYMDAGGPDRSDFGQIDATYQMITDGDLARAPGWAYAPFMVYVGGDLVLYRVPHGIEGEGALRGFACSGDESCQSETVLPGENIIISTAKDMLYNDIGAISVIDRKGGWKLDSIYAEDVDQLVPQNGFGDERCNPVNADFDGDGFDDRAVQCPDGWRIAYNSLGEGDNLPIRSLIVGSFRELPQLGYDLSKLTVPGRPVYGGISYIKTIELMEKYMQDNPGKPSPIFVDMVRLGLN